MSSYSYPYPRPAVSADCLVLAMENSDLKILLIKRGKDPFKDCWALPGGFLEIEEDLDDTAQRELTEETGLINVRLEQFRAFGKIGRDPRTRVITVSYFAMVRMNEQPVQAADDASEAGWFSVRDLPGLAFDHQTIINQLLDELRLRLRCQPFGLELLPDEFSLAQLQELYELLLDKKLASQSFRTQILDSGLVTEATNNLFGFDEKKYRAAMQDGMTFVP